MRWSSMTIARSGEKFPGHHIEQQARPDYRARGNGHPATIGKVPGSEVRPRW